LAQGGAKDGHKLVERAHAWALVVKSPGVGVFAEEPINPQRGRTMKIEISSYSVFGSGASWASLSIDGQRITRAVAETNGWPLVSEDNGFVGYTSADIPIDMLREAQAVEWDRGASPGGDRKICCGGPHFIKRFLGCRPGRDPLLEAGRYRASKAASLRLQRWHTGLKAWALETGYGRLNDAGTWEWRETFRLPDGCLGGRWTRFQPGCLPYPVPVPTR
jgi:hypothetical protein